MGGAEEGYRRKGGAVADTDALWWIPSDANSARGVEVTNGECFS
jgi:hypothetical protein